MPDLLNGTAVKSTSSLKKKKKKIKAKGEEPLAKKKKVDVQSKQAPIKAKGDEPLAKKTKVDVQSKQAPEEVKKDVVENQEASPQEPKLNENSPEVLGDFKKFQISKKTIDLLEKQKITYLFPIQYKTINHIFDGKDLIAQARTGTGKTLAFAIPIVEMLRKNIGESVPVRGRPPKALVLAPTRELVLQIYHEFLSIGNEIKVMSIYGGTPYFPQESALHNGMDIVVGTPGRVLDLIEKRACLDLSAVEHVILDEVDVMLDMGFSESVDDILKHAYSDRQKKPQTLLFSATCPFWVEKIARKYMAASDTVRVDTIGDSVLRTAVNVKHLAICCQLEDELFDCIGDVVRVHSGKHGKTLIFTDTKMEANTLYTCSSMLGLKIQLGLLHGDKSQKEREMTLKGFRSGTVHCLIATNVAARGLDIPEVDLVIQVSPPKDIDSYIHRSGRTGRAGRTGLAICFYKFYEAEKLKDVESRAGIRFKHVGPPQPQDLQKAINRDAIAAVQAVDKKLVKQFMETATLIAESMEGGPMVALAAALAEMTGATTMSCRSLIDSRPNFRTWVFSGELKFFVRTLFEQIEKQLGSEIRNLLVNLRMSTDEKQAVFDLPEEWTKEIEDTWVDTKFNSLKIAESLPTLKKVQSSPFFGFSRSNSRRGGGGGFRGRGKRGNGRYRNLMGSDSKRSKFL